MKVTKENVIAQVESSVSSIFSKEDVLFLINSIEGGGRSITVTEIGAAIDKIVDRLERDEDEVVDLDSIELTLNYDNRVEVERIRINFDFIREALESTLMDLGEVEEVQENEL